MFFFVWVIQLISLFVLFFLFYFVFCQMIDGVFDEGVFLDGDLVVKNLVEVVVGGGQVWFVVLEKQRCERNF